MRLSAGADRSPGTFLPLQNPARVEVLRSLHKRENTFTAPERAGQERPPYNILLEINADLNQGRYLDDNILIELI